VKRRAGYTGPAMRVAVLAVLAWAWIAAVGCTEPRSAACKEVCKREAECVDTTGNKVPFDEKECIAACAALEHDDCVNKQQACPAVLECK